MGRSWDRATDAPVPLARSARHVRLLVTLADLTEIGPFCARTLTLGLHVTGCCSFGRDFRTALTTYARGHLPTLGPRKNLKGVRWI